MAAFLVACNIWFLEGEEVWYVNVSVKAELEQEREEAFACMAAAAARAGRAMRTRVATYNVLSPELCSPSVFPACKAGMCMLSCTLAV